MVQVRIASYVRKADGTWSIYDIFELDRGKYVRKFYRAAMIRFITGDTDMIQVGPATEIRGWRGRIAAVREHHKPI